VAAVLSATADLFLVHASWEHGFGVIPQFFSGLVYRVIVLFVSIGFGWTSGGQFAVMHLWLAVGTIINFVLLTRAASWLRTA